MLRMLFLLLLFIPNIAISADDLGRLFTTPVQRESLNHLRKITPKFEAVNPAQTEESATEIAQPVMPSSVSMQGYVKRSDGKKGTVWVNNTPVQENSSTNEVEVGKLGKGNQVQLKVPGLDKNLNLKAGQVYVPGTGSISEINAHAEDSPAIGEDVGTVSDDSMDKSFQK